MKLFDLAWRKGIRIVNCLILLLLVVVLGYLITVWEYSDRVIGEATFEFANAKLIFSPEDGFFSTKATCGQQVKTGEVVGYLEEDEAAYLARMDLKSQLRDNELKADYLRRTSRSPEQLEVLEKEKLSLQSRLIELERRQKKREILSPAVGQLVSSSYPEIPPDDYENISKIQGTVFSDENRVCFDKRSDLLGYVGNPDRLLGTIQVQEKEVELIKVGQSVRVQSGNSESWFEAEITNVGLTSDEMILETGNPEETDSNSVTVEIEMEYSEQFRLSGTYRVAIMVNKTTLGGRITRWFRQAFWH